LFLLLYLFLRVHEVTSNEPERRGMVKGDVKVKRRAPWYSLPLATFLEEVVMYSLEYDDTEQGKLLV
jgi:hypothetical protein